MNLPGKWNLFEFTGMPDFNHWDEGIKATNQYKELKEKIEEQKKLYNLIKIGGIVLGIMTFRFGIGSFLLIAAFIFRKKGGKYRKLDDQLNTAYNDYMKVWHRHSDIFIYPLVEKIFPNEEWQSFRHIKEGLIYSKKGLIYYESDSGLLVAYDKSNIKEVSRERLHIGANTTGSSGTTGVGYTFQNTGITVGGATTQTTSNMTNYYEWHFDIMTDFMSYPKVSLVLEDTPNIEDFIGRAYAILKP